MKRTIIALTLAAALMSGCRPPAPPVAVSGSKADATFTFMSRVNEFQVDHVTWDVADLQADKLCKLWGYRRAEGFNQVNACALPYNCTTWVITRQYQCTNR